MSGQGDLFYTARAAPKPPFRFDGSDYVPPRDEPRLTTQHLRVRSAALAWPGGWFTMPALAEFVGEPAGSVERQVRYLRAPRFGGYEVAKRHVGGGTFEYRVTTTEERNER